MFSMFKEAGGQFSSMRVVMFMVVGAFLFQMVYLTIKTGQPVALDWEEVSMIVAMFAGKTVSKKFENGNGAKK